MSPSYLPPDTLLRKCPEWSTMQWVSITAMTRIHTRTKPLARARHGSRRDLVGIMVMYLAPEAPDELWELVEPYRTVNPPGKGKGDYQALMARLPSPVSLRLDALVAAAGTIKTVFRQEVIGALAVSSLPDEEDRLLDLYDRYYNATAGEAEVSSVKKHSVLRKKPPRPGRRRTSPA